MQDYKDVIILCIVLILIFSPFLYQKGERDRSLRKIIKEKNKAIPLPTPEEKEILDKRFVESILEEFRLDTAGTRVLVHTHSENGHRS